MLRLLALIAVLLALGGVAYVLFRGVTRPERPEGERPFLPTSPTGWFVLLVVGVLAVWFVGGMISAGT